MAEQKTYTAQNVAKYLIRLASRECVGDDGEREGITNLKLQKMLYFAQVYFLATMNRPLFSDRIEAWEYGPVVPCIYRQYKKTEATRLYPKKTHPRSRMRIKRK